MVANLARYQLPGHTFHRVVGRGSRIDGVRWLAATTRMLGKTLGKEYIPGKAFIGRFSAANPSQARWNLLWQRASVRLR